MKTENEQAVAKNPRQHANVCLRPTLRAAHNALLETKGEIAEILATRRVKQEAVGRSPARREFAERLAVLRETEENRQNLYQYLSTVRRELRLINRELRHVLEAPFATFLNSR